MKRKRASYATVWALLQETDRLMKESAEKAAERQAQWEEKAAEQQAKWQEKAAEQQARWQQEREQRQKENAEWRKEVERMIKESNKQVGGLGNSLGDLAEHLFAPGAARRFNELGFHFAVSSPGGRIFHDEQTGKAIVEVDILLENGETIMAVEVKAKLGRGDIGDQAKRMKKLREIYSQKGDKRKLYGAVALAVCRATDRQMAHKAGFYLLEQSGDTVKLEVSEGFVPKEW